MTSKLAENNDARDASERMHALGRIGEPDDVARALEFLLHPDNSFITGERLQAPSAVDVSLLICSDAFVGLSRDVLLNLSTMIIAKTAQRSVELQTLRILTLVQVS